jgi:hypothetical protein
LLQKSHQILKSTPTVTPTDDFEDNELVSYIMANEMAHDGGQDIAGCGRFWNLSKTITMYRRLTRSFYHRKVHLDSLDPLESAE